MTAGKRILVVDDEEIIRDLLKETFNRKGYEVVAVDKGRDALVLLDDQRFDLVVTDLRLPDISGMRILSEAKKKLPDLGVIMGALGRHPLHRFNPAHRTRLLHQFGDHRVDGAFQA